MFVLRFRVPLLRGTFAWRADFSGASPSIYIYIPFSLNSAIGAIYIFNTISRNLISLNLLNV